MFDLDKLKQDLTKEYYSVPEAARFLLVNRNTVLNWIKTKKINITKTLKGQNKISREEIIRIRKEEDFTYQ